MGEVPVEGVVVVIQQNGEEEAVMMGDAHDIMCDVEHEFVFVQRQDAMLDIGEMGSVDDVVGRQHDVDVDDFESLCEPIGNDGAHGHDQDGPLHTTCEDEPDFPDFVVVGDVNTASSHHRGINSAISHSHLVTTAPFPARHASSTDCTCEAPMGMRATTNDNDDGNSGASMYHAVSTDDVCEDASCALNGRLTPADVDMAITCETTAVVAVHQHGDDFNSRVHTPLEKAPSSAVSVGVTTTDASSTDVSSDVPSAVGGVSVSTTEPGTAVARCPSCLRTFNPRCPEIRWQCVHAHLKSCNPGLPSKLVLYRPHNGGKSDGCKYQCPVDQCEKRFTSRPDAYEHVCCAASIEHKRFRAKTCHVEWSAPQSMRRRGHLTNIAQSTDDVSLLVSQLRAKERAAAKAMATMQAKQLYSSAKGNDVVIIRWLLAGGAGKFNPNRGGEDGYTSLMTAAEAGHAEVVQELLADHRVSPNLRNTYGQTALSFAAQNGHSEVVAVMLQCPRVAVGMQTSGGRTAADVARAAGHGEIAHFIDMAIAALGPDVASDSAMAVGVAPLDDCWDEIDDCGDTIEAALAPAPSRSRYGIQRMGACWAIRKSKRWSKEGRTTSRRCAVSMYDRLLRVRPPTADELRAIMPVTMSNQHETNTTEYRSSGSLSFNCNAFLARYHGEIMREFPSATVVPFGVNENVLRRFTNACEEHEVFPELGFHGSPERNHESIRKNGLCNPAKTSFIPSSIAGVYTTRPGNGFYSRYYTDTEDVFVCGIVVPRQRPMHAATGSKRVGADGSQQSTSLRRRPKRVGQHRAHRRPAQSVATPALTPVSESPLVVEYDGVRVVHDDRLVAPLFVAKGAFAGAPQSLWSRPFRTKAHVPKRKDWPELPGESPNKERCKTPWVGRHRRWIDGADEAVWLPAGTAVGDKASKHAKRRFESKQRFLSRGEERAAKRNEQCAFT